MMAARSTCFADSPGRPVLATRLWRSFQTASAICELAPRMRSMTASSWAFKRTLD